MDEILARPVVCVIAIDASSDRNAILLQRRTKGATHGRFYGLWELPQGKIRAGETIFEGANRELKEESGLDAIALHDLHSATVSHFDDEVQSFTPLTCVFDLKNQCIGLAVVIFTEGIPHDTTEASDHCWMEQEEIADLIANGEVFPLNVLMIEKFFNKTAEENG